MKKFNIPILITFGVIMLLISSSWLSRNLGEKTGNGIVSQNGTHRHTTLEIYVDGVKQNLPPGIGLGAAHQPMHTHDPDNVMHVEMEGIVKQKDLTLGKFFRIWGKSFDSFGALQSMTVNSKETNAGENYIMEDKDMIELRYLSSTNPANGATSTSSAKKEGAQSVIRDLESAQFRDLIARNDVFTVNVHIPYEGEITGTDTFIPYDTIALSLNKLPQDKNAEIALYCKSGRMSTEAAETLASLGYTRVYNLTGGMNAWEKSGYLVEQNNRP